MEVPEVSTFTTSSGSAKSERNSQFYKTKRCPWFFVGRCTRGATCNWAHSDEEKRYGVDLTKTKMCPSVLKRVSCDDPLCRYAHHYSELRATTDLYKTSLCGFWIRGFCSAGTNCRHAHGQDELRLRPASVSGFSPSVVIPSSSDVSGLPSPNTIEYLSSRRGPYDPSRCPPPLLSCNSSQGGNYLRRDNTCSRTSLTGGSSTSIPSSPSPRACTLSPSSDAYYHKDARNCQVTPTQEVSLGRSCPWMDSEVMHPTPPPGRTATASTSTTFCDDRMGDDHSCTTRHSKVSVEDALHLHNNSIATGDPFSSIVAADHLHTGPSLYGKSGRFGRRSDYNNNVSLCARGEKGFARSTSCTPNRVPCASSGKGGVVYPLAPHNGRKSQLELRNYEKFSSEEAKRGERDLRYNEGVLAMATSRVCAWGEDEEEDGGTKNRVPFTRCAYNGTHGTEADEHVVGMDTNMMSEYGKGRATKLQTGRDKSRNVRVFTKAGKDGSGKGGRSQGGSGHEWRYEGTERVVVGKQEPCKWQHGGGKCSHYGESRRYSGAAYHSNKLQVLNPCTYSEDPSWETNSTAGSKAYQWECNEELYRCHCWSVGSKDDAAISEEFGNNADNSSVCDDAPTDENVCINRNKLTHEGRVEGGGTRLAVAPRESSCMNKKKRQTNAGSNNRRMGTPLVHDEPLLVRDSSGHSGRGARVGPSNQGIQMPTTTTTTALIVSSPRPLLSLSAAIPADNIKSVSLPTSPPPVSSSFPRWEPYAPPHPSCCCSPLQHSNLPVGTSPAPYPPSKAKPCRSSFHVGNSNAVPSAPSSLVAVDAFPMLHATRKSSFGLCEGEDGKSWAATADNKVSSKALQPTGDLWEDRRERWGYAAENDSNMSGTLVKRRRGSADEDVDVGKRSDVYYAASTTIDAPPQLHSGTTRVSGCYSAASTHRMIAMLAKNISLSELQEAQHVQYED